MESKPVQRSVAVLHTAAVDSSCHTSNNPFGSSKSDGHLFPTKENASAAESNSSSSRILAASQPLSLNHAGQLQLQQKLLAAQKKPQSGTSPRWGCTMTCALPLYEAIERLECVIRWNTETNGVQLVVVQDEDESSVVWNRTAKPNKQQHVTLECQMPEHGLCCRIRIEALNETSCQLWVRRQRGCALQQHGVKRILWQALRMNQAEWNAVVAEQKEHEGEEEEQRPALSLCHEQTAAPPIVSQQLKQQCQPSLPCSMACLKKDLAQVERLLMKDNECLHTQRLALECLVFLTRKPIDSKPTTNPCSLQAAQELLVRGSCVLRESLLKILQRSLERNSTTSVSELELQRFCEQRVLALKVVVQCLEVLVTEQQQEEKDHDNFCRLDEGYCKSLSQTLRSILHHTSCQCHASLLAARCLWWLHQSGWLLLTATEDEASSVSATLQNYLRKREELLLDSTSAHQQQQQQQ